MSPNMRNVLNVMISNKWRNLHLNALTKHRIEQKWTTCMRNFTSQNSVNSFSCTKYAVCTVQMYRSNFNSTRLNNWFHTRVRFFLH